MIEQGFEADIPPAAERQAESLQEPPFSPLPPQVRDLRALLWSSIDNDESRDLDQIEWAERREDGTIRVLVGIADVDTLAPAGSPIDRHAGINTTTVYTGVSIFPMLPERLSTGLTSLNPDSDRLALIIEMVVCEDGTVCESDVYRAVVRNHAQLAYDALSAWLEGTGPEPPRIAQLPGLDAQVRLQNEAAQCLHQRRAQHGALELETIEARPVMEGEQVVDLAVPPKNIARALIEDFMVAANTTIAAFLQQKGSDAIQRVVRAPERWNRIVDLARSLGTNLPPQPDSRALAGFLAQRKAADPDRFPDLSLSIVKLLGPGEYTLVRANDDSSGHFGLAVHNYAHSTAPNRRYADLITQRLLKAALAGDRAPYSDDELEQIAQQCTEREDAARKVERLVRKVAAAVLFSDRIGQTFDAIVTGASSKGVYARVISPPVEGRIVHGEFGLDVGDHVHVRLIATDSERGFIDFARVH